MNGTAVRRRLFVFILAKRLRFRPVRALGARESFSSFGIIISYAARDRLFTRHCCRASARDHERTRCRFLLRF